MSEDDFATASEIRTNRETVTKPRDACSEPTGLNGTHEADIYTYDLPDLTSYTFVSGKRFKEYAIPVKDERVAYGPNLDPLEVFVIPFSHVDPGYGMTFEVYYQRKSKHTLDSMVIKLEQYPDMTFQWAEVIFLERWWRDISDDVKQRVRILVQDGRLEIVSGGWVMPDEAITHYSPVIDQLIEGHQWLWENLGVKPKNNWANDPFGYSSTFPYLWRKSGMDNMVILRINQAIKGTLMKQQALEFNWKPLWSKDSSNDILCHVMPYRGYWIGDTCGPYNQHICREYAFMHTNPIHKVVFVNPQNVESRARILYEQYRITAEIYRRDVLNTNGNIHAQKLYLPIFLGEDFSYTTEKEFDLIYQNYMKLFKHMNSKKEWKIKLKFGTVDEYFTKIKSNQENRTIKDGSRFPNLMGDFLPYLDYQSDFWTGYYSTRPFNKQLSRELQSTIKMADIFNSYAFARAQYSKSSYKSFLKVTSLLRDARRDFGMFLHHDGITGTSVLPVIQDFQNKIAMALNKAQLAMKLVTTELLTFGLLGIEVLEETMKRNTVSSISIDKTLKLSTDFRKGGSLIFVTNPSARRRTDVVSFVGHTKDKYIFISSADHTIHFQKRPVLKDIAHRISFAVDMPPFSIQTFRIETFKRKKDMESLYEEDIIKKQPELRPHSTTEFVENENIILENIYLSVEIDNISGFPKTIKIKNSMDSDVHFLTQILAYRSLRSGAYIFAPDGDAKQFLSSRPRLRVFKGTLISEVVAIYPAFSFITKLYNVNGTQGMGVHITTEFDMSIKNSHRNTELIVRFQTDINNGNNFFTDQNSFQLIGRKQRADRLVEENYYPITSMMVIEDAGRRLTLHAAQPHGAACLRTGWMEVMLDRRVTRDDNKGLGQGVMDNVLTVANFVLQVEPKSDILSESEEYRYTFPSESNMLMNELLNEPTYTLFADEAKQFRENGLDTENLQFIPLKTSLACGVSVVGMRNLAKSDLTYNGTSLILHFRPSHCRLPLNNLCSSGSHTATIQSFYPDMKIKTARETSLTHLYDLGEIDTAQDITPPDMELRSFRIEL